MSAIWGAIVKTKEKDLQQVAMAIKSGYEKCVIDEFREFCSGQVLMGCGIQYFTKEAAYEKLPLADEKKQVYFTADAIVDNRKELIERLGWAEKEEVIPDGLILYEMFSRYGEDCLNDIVGAYAFAHYDDKTDTLTIVTDATGYRCIHYTIKEGAIYFSTLPGPILQYVEKVELNERWMVDFLALDNLAHMTEYCETPYRDIFKVPAGTVLKICHGVKQQYEYWNPVVKPIKCKNTAEYEALFKKTFSACVDEMLRNDVSTLLLSGGLDSNLVAHTALPLLKERGQKLITFTSVPEETYQAKGSTYYITNEGESVKKTQAFYREKGYEMECHFMDLAGVNGWDSRKEILPIVQMPYKSMQNCLWMFEGLKQSYQKGARVLLNGAYGNVSVSADFANSYLRHLLKHFRWIEFIGENYCCAKRSGRSVKQMPKVMLSYIKDCYKKKQPQTLEQFLGQSYVKKEACMKHNVSERLLADKTEAITIDALKAAMKNEVIFAQKSITGTCFSLYTGVILRDPTMDKRIIEMCMGWPVSEFVKNGETRRLVRGYYKNDMPPHILRPGQYGVQSADLVERFWKKKDTILREMHQIVESGKKSNIVDCERLLKGIEDIGNSEGKIGLFELLRVEYSLLALEFEMGILFK